MDTLKSYLIKNFEQSFVLTILLGVVFVIYFVPYKLAFLNFFFLPILLAAYYLNVRSAVLGALFTTIVVTVYVYLYPDRFSREVTTVFLMVTLATWSGFLILTGVVVGYLQRELLAKIEHAAAINSELTGSKELLQRTSSELQDYIENLDLKVSQRTETLEKYNRAIEEHKQKVEEALFSTMDPAVAKLMIEKRLRTEHRRISVQFCDLKDFTSFSEEHSAEVVVTQLNKHLSEMETTLLDFKAHIDKYLGDGIMSEFGAPNDYEQYALLAVACAWKMQEQVKNNDSNWQMRIGIATGECITGLVGHKRQAYTALGDTVNLASRIEEICLPGRVTVDQATFDDTSRWIEYRRRTVLHADGDTSITLQPQLTRLLEQLDHSPNHIDLLLEVADLYLQLHEIEQARNYFKRIVEIEPQHERAKLLFAEASLELDREDDIPIRGRKQTIHLFEIKGIVNPLENRQRIPRAIYHSYHTTVAELLPYPENILLPVECIEGSVGHSRVVGFLSYVIADYLGLGDREKQDILEAGYLSDIGKSIIPHHLLNRCGRLSTEEFVAVHKHPRESVRKLKQMGYESDAIFEIIENHHENVLGGGYPMGKTKQDIPIGARIVAVAEAYSSLTSWRPYRESWERSSAYAEMQRDTANGKFDPHIIDLLGDIILSDRPTAAAVHLR